MQNEIKTIAVIGAAEKGRALTEEGLRAGYRIVLEDVIEARLQEAAGSLAELGCETRSRLAAASTVEEALRDADLVIETVADELEMKLELFTIFDKFAKPSAILASTSESIPIADLAEMTACPERCIGFRFVATNTVELRCAIKTSVETIVACGELARRMGRAVAIISDELRAGAEQTM
jgi:3-hydroxybutyryl-CoA dehydrogenase